VKKTRQNKNLEPRSDAIGTEKAQGKAARRGSRLHDIATSSHRARLAGAEKRVDDPPTSKQ
jgi:hypothetical protein